MSGRWRVRVHIPLPGPWVLMRERKAHSKVHGVACQRVPSAAAGWASLFVLGWLVSWRWRTRHARRAARVTRWIPGWVIVTGLVLLIVAVLIVI